MNSSWIWLLLGIIILIIIVGLIIALARRRSSSDLLEIPEITNYSIQEYPNFLTSEECDRLRQLAQHKGMFDSRVYGSGTDRLDLKSRISQQAWLDDSDDPVVAALSHKVATLVGLPVSYQESLQVVKYLPGGKFEAHYDACDERTDKCQGMNGRAGPRYATVLIYLNDGFTGGTTSFPKLGMTVHPEKGKAILFYDVHPKTLRILDKSFHSGDPLVNGEKWVCNAWVHLKPWK
jgi:prolyl 4-hydroxylase